MGKTKIKPVDESTKAKVTPTQADSEKESTETAKPHDHNQKESPDTSPSPEEKTSSEASEEKAPAKPVVKTGSKRKKQPKGKKYLASRELVNPDKSYSLKSAIELIKKVSYTKFDGSVEIHVSTTTKKGQDALRGLIHLPAGSPKQPKIAVADEALIEKVKAGKIDFDILIATPALMPKLATVAKILGPKGLMPSPKSGTVVDDPKTAMEEFSKGRVEYKADPLGNIHAAVGKVSWKEDKLEQNILAVLSALPANRIKTTYISATMSPSIRIK